MEMMSKVSKGSMMDQIYIPKNRVGFGVGSHVIIRPLKIEKSMGKPYFYNVGFIEPVKLELIKNIFNTLDNVVACENIIITGSFLQPGFNFEDIDVLIISRQEINKKEIERKIRDTIKIENHVISFDRGAFVEALKTDPLWRMMLSKCVSKYRLTPIPKKRINYKILDLHLLKSKSLIDNFDYLNGKEKYKLTRNLIAIKLFLARTDVTKSAVDKEIRKVFGISAKQIKENMLDGDSFIGKYRNAYRETFNRIMIGIRNGPKQK